MEYVGYGDDDDDEVDNEFEEIEDEMMVILSW